MQGLMLHCGAGAVTRDELQHLPVPKPKGPRHAIRPFYEDVEVVREDVQTRLGMRIVDEGYGVLNDRESGLPQRFFGVMQIHSDNHDFGLMIGMRGSYDQSLSRSLAVGSRVFVCDNLAFSGEINIRTKQTTNIARRIPEMMHRAIDQIPAMVQVQEKRFDNYRNQVISQRDGDAALIEMVRRGALMPTQLGRALAEWDNPSHPEHAEQGFSVWRLHNAVTEAIKPSNEQRDGIRVAWSRTQTMTPVLDNLLEAA